MPHPQPLDDTTPHPYTKSTISCAPPPTFGRHNSSSIHQIHPTPNLWTTQLLIHTPNPQYPVPHPQPLDDTTPHPYTKSTISYAPPPTFGRHNSSSLHQIHTILCPTPNLWTTQLLILTPNPQYPMPHPQPLDDTTPHPYTKSTISYAPPPTFGRHNSSSLHQIHNILCPTPNLWTTQLLIHTPNPQYPVPHPQPLDNTTPHPYTKSTLSCAPPPTFGRHNSSSIHQIHTILCPTPNLWTTQLPIHTPNPQYPVPHPQPLDDTTRSRP